MSEFNLTKQYIEETCSYEPDFFHQIRDSIIAAGINEMSIDADSAQLLRVLIKTAGVKKVLELGTLGGYSAILFASILPHDGHVTTIDNDIRYQPLSKGNAEKTGYKDKITFICNDGLKAMEALAAEGETFDFFFIDAAKNSYINYYEWALAMAKPGSLIVADNTLWKDEVPDPDKTSNPIRAMRRFNEYVGKDDRVDAIITTTGDGMTIARVK
ncbi:O-methyltransferase [Brochothrix campestris]|uniref:O-methyltransferase n=1 Tax=Brochothrix campestris FSL F6-1037 TaxID=1265861 RepID=W7CTM1_9LIST|nr:O-methyltransferase [Brochothrix campestris]EUJ39176.1 O-methyltransferase [Brochothrix campestris FSL F6-1037]